MPTDPLTALQRLRDGNRRFVDGESTAAFTLEQRASSLEGQTPFACIVGCSDSRVPVEAVFDAGVGQLFVVRTAGHVLANASLASIRFAVEKLGVGAVVVLGHEDCGAVSAALSEDAPDWLAPIVGRIDVSRIDPFLAPSDADDPLLAAAVDMHVRDTVEELRDWFAELEIDEEPLVFGAAYKLATGEVHWLD